jgi:hypothetical protein
MEKQHIYYIKWQENIVSKFQFISNEGAIKVAHEIQGYN